MEVNTPVFCTLLHSVQIRYTYVGTKLDLHILSVGWPYNRFI